MLKKITIFLYITAIGMTLNLLKIPIKYIQLKPFRSVVNDKFQSFINKPIIFLNPAIVEYILKFHNRFYQNIKVEYLSKSNAINIDFQYKKPSLIYKNSVVTSDGKFFYYNTTLLLPTVNESINKKDIVFIAKNLSKYFSIKSIETIEYNNYNWIIKFRNQQLWYLGWDLNKFFNIKNKFNKKIIKNIVNNPQYEKIYFIKKKNNYKFLIKSNSL
jgi:hypothetical protein